MGRMCWTDHVKRTHSGSPSRTFWSAQPVSFCSLCPMRWTLRTSWPSRTTKGWRKDTCMSTSPLATRWGRRLTRTALWTSPVNCLGSLTTSRSVAVAASCKTFLIVCQPKAFFTNYCKLSVCCVFCLSAKSLFLQTTTRLWNVIESGIFHMKQPLMHASKIIMMEICKAPTPQLKALNKHSTRSCTLCTLRWRMLSVI